jgi:hypothetical protein
LENENEKLILINDYGFLESNSYMIFSIKDATGKKYYVNSMAVGVYHNKLEILETSIGRYYMGNPGEKILWYTG